jgi:serine/threonine protein kinase
MDLCDKTLKQIIDEIRNDSIFRKDNILTPIAYFLLSQIFIEILESVQFLHENHIIHRDLNPYNIMLKINSNIKCFIRIVDFGLVAIHELVGQSHSSNQGNIEYIASKVFDGRIYDTKADIYSLGILLSHLFDIDIEKVCINQFLNNS